MRILYDSILDDTNLYTPVSENANYPIENIYNEKLSREYRTTGITAENIVIDAGVGNTLDADTFTISGHNFTSSATLKIQANATDSWGAPTLDTSITYGAETIATSFTGTDLRFWRFTMADATNTDGYLKMGRLMLGDYLQITKGASKRFMETINDTTSGYTSGGGQYYAVQGYRYRTYDLNFPYWSNSMRESIRTILASVQNVSPVVLIIDESNTDTLYPVYCIIEGDFNVTHLHDYKWSGNLEFREVK